MLNLVDYGSSDEETEAQQKSNEIRADSLISSLPKPTSVASRKSQEEGALEEITKKHKWESQPTEKQPLKKNRGPVKISIPEVPLGNESDDDDDEDNAPRKVRGPSGPSALLSILPAPKTKSVDKKSKSTNAPNLFTPVDDGIRQKKTTTTVSTNFIPRTVAAAPKPSVASKIVDVESDDEDSGDFFSLEKQQDGEEESFDVDPASYVRSTTDIESGAAERSVASVHPSQMYNYAASTSSSSTAFVSASEEDDGLREARKIIYQHELQSFGDDYVLPEDLTIVDVSVDSQLGNVRENLLRNITDAARPVDMALEAARAAIAGGSKKKKDKPSQTAKRKHQITYLAHLAKEREDSLKNQWAQNKHNKRQTQMKYGF